MVRTFYGVDQADQAGLVAIVDEVIPGQELDLVIDDASHRYDETRASFEVLYHTLRAGGLYIVEDWAANYAYARRIAETLSGPSTPTSEGGAGAAAGDAAAESDRVGPGRYPASGSSSSTSQAARPETS